DAGMAAMGNSNGSTSSIYGTLFMGVSDGIASGAESLGAEALASAFKAGLESMRAIVKGDVGDKTCFDALIPAIGAMQGKATVQELLDAAAKAADEGAQNTVNLRAKFGRARNLGEKSVGTLDPGAVSNALIFAKFAEAFKA
ncbi:MAG: dihydroxyacetone kinase subunit L, partial [Opitutales bacterium]|nr:dihydroxyacetone kinase subunit L [Opitutales bacterium]